jgi:hypothetical protein
MKAVIVDVEAPCLVMDVFVGAVEIALADGNRVKSPLSRTMILEQLDDGFFEAHDVGLYVGSIAVECRLGIDGGGDDVENSSHFVVDARIDYGDDVLSGHCKHVALKHSIFIVKSKRQTRLTIIAWLQPLLLLIIASVIFESIQDSLWILLLFLFTNLRLL